MTLLLKQSTAVTIKLGPFVDATDGSTAETALTITQADIRLSKNGGDIAQSNNSAGATHDELGYYDVPLNTTDTGTLGTLRVLVSESGALPVWQDFMVLPANVYDSLVLGSDTLDVQVTGVGANVLTASALATDAVTEIQSGLATAAALTTVDTVVDAIQAKTDNLPASPAATGDIPTSGDIANAVWDEPLTQPSGPFAWAGSFRNALNWLAALSRNKMVQTDEETVLRNDADDADIAASAISDDGTIFVRSEWV